MNLPAPAMVTVTMPMEIQVPQQWIDLLTKYGDIFLNGYCGYWLQGIAQGELTGWLAFERGGEKRATEPAISKNCAAWHANKPLSKRFFRIDRELAIKAYVEGVKRWGVGWYGNADASSYDVVIQLAMLGEVRYG